LEGGKGADVAHTDLLLSPTQIAKTKFFLLPSDSECVNLVPHLLLLASYEEGGSCSFVTTNL